MNVSRRIRFSVNFGTQFDVPSITQIRIIWP